MPTTYAIPNGRTVMDATLWTENDSATQTISNLQFQPDFVWGKNRTDAYYHNLFDSVRGAGGNKELGSQSTGAEGYAATSAYDYLSSFDADGFTSTYSGSNFAAYFNNNTNNYVAWNWKAASSNTTNSSGSVTAINRVNSTAGFSTSVFTTPTSGTYTVGHSLSSTPNLVIFKSAIQIMISAFYRISYFVHKSF